MHAWFIRRVGSFCTHTHCTHYHMPGHYHLDRLPVMDISRTPPRSYRGWDSLHRCTSAGSLLGLHSHAFTMHTPHCSFPPHLNTKTPHVSSAWLPFFSLPLHCRDTYWDAHTPRATTARYLTHTCTTHAAILPFGFTFTFTRSHVARGLRCHLWLLVHVPAGCVPSLPDTITRSYPSDWFTVSWTFRYELHHRLHVPGLDAEHLLFIPPDTSVYIFGRLTNTTHHTAFLPGWTYTNTLPHHLLFPLVCLLDLGFTCYTTFWFVTWIVHCSAAYLLPHYTNGPHHLNYLHLLDVWAPVSVLYAGDS